ncbi:hypothetical protein ACHAO5_009293, partial [Verticillium nonalfalfae]
SRHPTRLPSVSPSAVSVTTLPSLRTVPQNPPSFASVVLLAPTLPAIQCLLPLLLRASTPLLSASSRHRTARRNTSPSTTPPRTSFSPWPTWIFSQRMLFPPPNGAPPSRRPPPRGSLSTRTGRRVISTPGSPPAALLVPRLPMSLSPP